MNLNKIQDNIYQTEQEIDYDCYQISDSDDSYHSNNDINLAYNEESYKEEEEIYDNGENALIRNLISYILRLFKDTDSEKLLGND